MKKLLIMVFAVLTVSVFAADETKETAVNTIENKNIETTRVLETKDIANVQVQQAPSLGDTFMAAFGMSEGSVGGQQGTGSSSSSSSTAAGVVSVAANSVTVSASNSTTIMTPYGKY